MIEVPIQWFATPYIVASRAPKPPTRAVRLEAYLAQAQADGGGLAYFECGGGPATHYPGGGGGATCGVAVGKVNAGQATLNAIAADAAITAIPVALQRLGDLMSGLTAAQQAAFIQTVLPWVGYTAAEINAFLGLAGNPTLAQQEAALAAKTFGQVLSFLNTHRYTTVYDSVTDQLWCDGRTMNQGTYSGQVSHAVPAPSGPENVDLAV